MKNKKKGHSQELGVHVGLQKSASKAAQEAQIRATGAEAPISDVLMS